MTYKMSNPKPIIIWPPNHISHLTWDILRVVKPYLPINLYQDPKCPTLYTKTSNFTFFKPFHQNHVKPIMWTLKPSYFILHVPYQKALPSNSQQNQDLLWKTHLFPLLDLCISQNINLIKSWSHDQNNRLPSSYVTY